MPWCLMSSLSKAGTYYSLYLQKREIVMRSVSKSSREIKAEADSEALRYF